MLGLLRAADRYPRDLATGERQRVALAAVLVGTPSLVLLDEPTRGMDAFARSALQGLVERLRDRGAAVVLATHDAELTDALADRVVSVKNGGALPLGPHLSANPSPASGGGGLPRERGGKDLL